MRRQEDKARREQELLEEKAHREQEKLEKKARAEQDCASNVVELTTRRDQNRRAKSADASSSKRSPEVEREDKERDFLAPEFVAHADVEPEQHRRVRDADDRRLKLDQLKLEHQRFTESLADKRAPDRHGQQSQEAKENETVTAGDPDAAAGRPASGKQPGSRSRSRVSKSRASSHHSAPRRHRRRRRRRSRSRSKPGELGDDLARRPPHSGRGPHGEGGQPPWMQGAPSMSAWGGRPGQPWDGRRPMPWGMPEGFAAWGVPPPQCGSQARGPWSPPPMDVGAAWAAPWPQGMPPGGQQPPSWGALPPPPHVMQMLSSMPPNPWDRAGCAGAACSASWRAHAHWTGSGPWEPRDHRDQSDHRDHDRRADRDGSKGKGQRRRDDWRDEKGPDGRSSANSIPVSWKPPASDERAASAEDSTAPTAQGSDAVEQECTPAGRGRPSTDPAWKTRMHPEERPPTIPTPPLSASADCPQTSAGTAFEQGGCSSPAWAVGGGAIAWTAGVEKNQENPLGDKSVGSAWAG